MEQQSHRTISHFFPHKQKFHLLLGDDDNQVTVELLSGAYTEGAAEAQLI